MQIFEVADRCNSPLSAAGEERVVERSDDGVSRCGCQALAVMSAGSTHPDYASLVDPLFRKRERG